MTRLEEMAKDIAAAEIEPDQIQFGPWLGRCSSKSADQVGREFVASGLDMNYVARRGSYKRRGGTSIKYDTYSTHEVLGLLPAKWSSRGRQMDEILGSDGVMTASALATKETIASGLDDGRFGNFYVRDQAAGVNYTLGSEFSSNTYPVASEQSYKAPPFWHASGAGFVGRGTAEFQRRLLFGPGSRSYAQIGGEVYLPEALGTPKRWNGYKAGTADQTAAPVSDNSAGGWSKFPGGSASNMWQAVDDASADLTAPPTDWIALIESSSTPVIFNLTTTLTNPGTLSATLEFDAYNTGSAPAQKRYLITIDADSGGTVLYNSNSSAMSATPTTYTVSMTFLATPTLWTGLRIGFAPSSTGGATDGEFRISRVKLTLTGSGSTSSRIAPTGPVCPTWGGRLAKGNAVATKTLADPDADLVVGAWSRAGVDSGTLYGQLSDLESSSVDTSWIQASTNTTCDVSLATLGATPDATDTVKVEYRTRVLHVSGTRPTLTMSLVDGSTVITSQAAVWSSGYQYAAFTLTAANIAAVSAWTNLTLRVVTASGTGSFIQQVSGAALTWAASASTSEGGWHGSDRFMHAIAYKDRSGAIWQATTPRFPNSVLANGLCLFTVDANNPTAQYDYIEWTLPVGPDWVDEVVMLRTTKIDSTTQDNLSIVALDLRLVWSVKNGTTTYRDYAADDDANPPDTDGLLYRTDHAMPWRCRWITAGDSRAFIGYGSGPNPCAIELAVIGSAADYDFNLADDAAALYTGVRHYYRLSTTGLTLVRDTGSATSYRTFAWADYLTLESLVDAINATACTDTWTALTGAVTLAAQWRAQVLPGQDPQAATSSLCPTIRSLDACTIASQTITRTSGLSDVPVGSWITSSGGGADSGAGAYVSKITDDGTLVFVGTLTAGGPYTLTFTADTGDSITGAINTTYEGYVRVIGNSHPGYLFFTTDYLEQFTPEKGSTWMTVANPASSKSAPNCWSGELANKHTPPSGAGVKVTGLGAVENWCFVGLDSKYGFVRNRREGGTGLDQDYHLEIKHDSSGVIGPVCVAKGCVLAFTSDGWIGAEPDATLLISAEVWDAATLTGDYVYEAPLCITAVSADTDTAMLSAKVMHSALHVNYRTAASSAHPNRRVVYDFSEGAGSGIASLVRARPLMDGDKQIAPAGALFGWSLPHVQSFTQMCEVRSSSAYLGTGSHLLAWNEQNQGSTGDGRIDEFETGDTDNGTAISTDSAAGQLLGPMFQYDNDDVCGVEAIFEHSSPAASVVHGVFVRSLAADTYTCTPDVSSTFAVSIYRWGLPLIGARVQSAVARIGWRQASGGASEIRRITLLTQRAKDYVLGSSG